MFLTKLWFSLCFFNELMNLQEIMIHRFDIAISYEHSFQWTYSKCGFNSNLDNVSLSLHFWTISISKRSKNKVHAIANHSICLTSVMSYSLSSYTIDRVRGFDALGMLVQQVFPGYRLKAFFLILIKIMPKERVALVTGCSTGRGYATSLMLARNVNAICLCY